MGLFEVLIVGIIGLLTVGVPATIVLWLVMRFARDARNPNLAACPDCGRRISLQARACPHCGAPQHASRASS
jgi:hypothetical protein